jgi:hypothetical protein
MSQACAQSNTENVIFQWYLMIYWRGMIYVFVSLVPVGNRQPHGNDFNKMGAWQVCNGRINSQTIRAMTCTIQ